MIKNSNKLILLILFFLIVSACSSNDSSGPELIEISSDEEGEEENDNEEALNFIPPELPDLPDPALSSSRWNQVNGPFGGTITSIFKSSNGYLSLIHISEPTDQRGSRMPSSA